jgi:hypothetical protein
VGSQPDRAHDGARRDEQQRRRLSPQEAIDLLSELEYDPKLAWNGWLDSTLDLRDGLSVVEVFASIDEPAALQELALLRR